MRCLGPAEKEHYFLSRDRANERICESCRKRIIKLGVMAWQVMPAKDERKKRVLDSAS